MDKSQSGVVAFLLFSSLSTLFQIGNALIPASPQQQTRQAGYSLRKAIKFQKEQKKTCRLFVDYLIPIPETTKAEDIDPWPGGLAQMYPYAEQIVQDILKDLVENPGECTSQIINPEDCCGFLVQESKDGPSEDVAAVIFPSVDQLPSLQQIDELVGPKRTLLLFNKQFQRLSDFGMGQRNIAEKIVFDSFIYGYAFQEFACRGEDTKLVYDFPKWESYVVCDEDPDKGRQEIELLTPQETRPPYDELETRINKVLPEPLWMRKMGEAKDKGFKFQRGER